MNSIQGKITNIETEGHFQLIEISSGASAFKSIIISHAGDAYQLGDAVFAHFKETEVSLATQRIVDISLQNQIEGQISKIEKDKLMCRVSLNTHHGPVFSVITTGSANRMGLKEGDAVIALIKTNEVMISRA